MFELQTPVDPEEEVELGRTLRAICAVGDSAPGTEEKLLLLNNLSSAHREAALQVLVQRLAEVSGTASELDQVNRSLHQMVESLSQHPWHVAVFKGWVDVAERRLARVFCAGEDRLVAVAPELDAELLGAGEAVFLSAERNTLMSAGAGRSRGGGQLGEVIEVYDQGDLVVREHDLNVTLERAHWLADTAISEGDQVVWCPRTHLVLGLLKSARVAGVSRLSADIQGPPPVFAGYEEIRDGAIQGFLCGLKNPEAAARYGIKPAQGALLLSGPPGCGKTLLARNLAHELGARFFVIDASSIYSAWVGESERHLIEAFRLARQSSPSVLFIDEIDAIGRIRGGVAQQHSDRVVSVLLTQMEGAAGQPGIALIGACNRVDLLDPALRARFGRQFLIPTPKKTALRAIANTHLSVDLPYATDETRERCVDAVVHRLCSPNAANAVATVKFRNGRTRSVTTRDLLSGRAIKQIVDAACEAAFRREVAQQTATGIDLIDVEIAVENMIGRWRSMLCADNVSSYLSDLPEDVDVVAVEPVADIVQPARYLAGSDAPEVIS